MRTETLIEVYQNADLPLAAGEAPKVNQFSIDLHDFHVKIPHNRWFVYTCVCHVSLIIPVIPPNDQ